MQDGTPPFHQAPSFMHSPPEHEFYVFADEEANHDYSDDPC